MLKDLYVNKYSLFIGLIIILSLNCFYLVNTSILPIDMNDITLLVEAAFAVYVYCQCGFSTDHRYAVWYLIPILLVISSSIMANINFGGQPIWYGIRSQRHWLVPMLMYFPINCLIKDERVTVDDLMNMLDKLMFIYCLLIVIQYFVGDSFTFMIVSTGERYSTMRLYCSTTFIELSFFYHLDRVIKGMMIRFMDIYMIFMCIFIVVFVTMSRMRSIALIGAVIIFLSTMRLSRRKLKYFAIVVIALCLFMASDAGQMIVENILEIGSSDEGSVLIREVGRQYYLSEAFSSPLKFLFGDGFANIDWAPTLTASRIAEGIYSTDNGIFGRIFYYGFSFVFWMIGMLSHMMSDSWKNESHGMFFYLLYGLLGCYSLVPNCYVQDLTFTLAGVMIENHVPEGEDSDDCVDVDHEGYESEN